jgi:metallo-beta-lactamase family protein
MCEAGRILHHPRNHIEDPATTICIVGFQAMHTLGRRLVERRSRAKIFGVERDLNARVVVMNTFSAHADKNELCDYARHTGNGAQRIFLVYGEPESQRALALALRKDQLPLTIPARDDVAQLE